MWTADDWVRGYKIEGRWKDGCLVPTLGSEIRGTMSAPDENQRVHVKLWKAEPYTGDAGDETDA